MLVRKSWKVKSPTTITLDTTLADTPAIDLREAAGGFVRAIEDCGACTFYGAVEADATFVQIYDSTNTAVSRTMTNARGYALPDECFAVRFLKIVPTNDAVDVEICLKG